MVLTSVFRGIVITGSVHIVGGGIAGLAAAALLIRDGGLPGSTIRIFEQSSLAGGSLDGSGDPVSGYVVRGGRMFEAHFGCTFDLFSSIPSMDDPAISVTQDILDFTQTVHTSSKARLVVNRHKVEAPEFGLSLRDRWDLGRLTLLSEISLGDKSIEDYFAPSFFDTHFWIMWCTMFAFQRWHSLAEFRRYMRRFMHLMPGFNRLEGIHRTRFNQYDSLVQPLVRWLVQSGVRLQTNARVVDLTVAEREGEQSIAALAVESADGREDIRVHDDDLVLLTLGSMTEDSTLGSRHQAAALATHPESGAWSLWRRLADQSAVFGRPDAFAGQIDKTLWQSFTVTLDNPEFFEFMQSYTGNAAGTGGLVTFRDSKWLLSVVLAYQPHFRGQPDDVFVFWGYGLHPHERGDLVDKPMLDCTGAEILQELFHHLPAGDLGRKVVEYANCIPCIMPFITSQFMPRRPGERPQVVPEGARNFALLGQYCEVPDDTVFTVEYSVRTAQVAVAQLLHLDHLPTPVHRGYRNPRVVLKALRALFSW